MVRCSHAGRESTFNAGLPTGSRSFYRRVAVRHPAEVKWPSGFTSWVHWETDLVREAAKDDRKSEVHHVSHGLLSTTQQVKEDCVKKDPGRLRLCPAGCISKVFVRIPQAACMAFQPEFFCTFFCWRTKSALKELILEQNAGACSRQCARTLPKATY